MVLWLWYALVVGAIGVGLVVYGATILVTGRATRHDQRKFRRLTDAGLFYLCFGLALAVLASGGLLKLYNHPGLAFAAQAVALVLVFLSDRYRPRRDKRGLMRRVRQLLPRTAASLGRRRPTGQDRTDSRPGRPV